MAADPRFLIVDDFSTMRRIVRNLLREVGFGNAEEAEDGMVALAMLKSSRFDIVVSDIRMPRMDGFELLRAIRSEETLKAIPVLMLSAEARREELVQVAQAGASGYLVKPFTKAMLEEKLRNILPRMR